MSIPATNARQHPSRKSTEVTPLLPPLPLLQQNEEPYRCPFYSPKERYPCFWPSLSPKERESCCCFYRWIGNPDAAPFHLWEGRKTCFETSILSEGLSQDEGLRIMWLITNLYEIEGSKPKIFQNDCATEIFAQTHIHRIFARIAFCK